MQKDHNIVISLLVTESQRSVLCVLACFSWCKTLFVSNKFLLFKINFNLIYFRKKKTYHVTNIQKESCQQPAKDCWLIVRTYQGNICNVSRGKETRVVPTPSQFRSHNHNPSMYVSPWFILLVQYWRHGVQTTNA